MSNNRFEIQSKEQVAAQELDDSTQYLGPSRVTSGPIGVQVHENVVPASVVVGFGAQSGTMCLVPGDESTRTSTEAAIMMGYAQRLPDGSVKLIEGALDPAAVEAEAEAQQKVAAEEAAENALLDEAGQEEFGKVMAAHPRIDQGTVDEALPLAAMALARGDDLSQVVTRISQRSGVDPADAEAALYDAAGVLQSRFDRVLEKAGLGDVVDQQSFISFIRETAANDFAQALSMTLLSNDASHLKMMATEYVRNTTPNESELQAVGYEVRRAADGQLLARDPETGKVVAAEHLRLQRPRGR